MSKLSTYPGIRLNGVFYPKADLPLPPSQEGLTAFDFEILDFAGKLLDDKDKVRVETSGSTGEPKVMKFSKEAILTSAKATNKWFGLQAQSTALLALPLRYIAGKMMVARAIVGGYNLLSVTPQAVPLPEVGSMHIDFLPLTPYQASCCAEECPGLLRKVGAVLIGGGQINEALYTRLHHLDVRAFASFGMTETLTHFAIAPLQTPGKLVYEPLSDVRLKTKKDGRLCVKWKGITDGWLTTNDLVEMHETGFEWLGRSDHLINSGGVKVIPELVEKRLAHLVKGNYFVAGMPHKRLGQEVALFVETKGEGQHISISDIQHVLSDTPFWQPRRIIEVSHFLYTSSGKVRRSEVVKQALQAEKAKV